MKITVLMSCFNSEKWLNSAIDSVISQTYENFEFLIINDGSTDGTLKLLNKYKTLDRRLKIISKNNTGLSDSLNIGIKEASGEWIARLDSDDICYKNRLQEQLKCVALNKNVILVGSSYDEIDENGRLVKFHKFPTRSSDINGRLVGDKTFFPHSSAFYNKKVVVDNGMYRGKIKRAEDLDLWLRLSRVGEIRSLPMNLVGIRKHQDQISHDEGGRRQIIDAVAAKVSHKIFLAYGEKYEPINKKEEEFNEYIKWLECCMDEYGIFEEMNAWKDFSAKYKSNPSLINRGAFVINELLMNSRVRNKFFRRISNKSTSSIFFDKWINLPGNFN